ncbi:glycoside hydrolase family 15 protein [Planomonospora algeriensis]
MKALRKLLARAAAAATVVLAVTAVAVPAQAADAPGAPGGGSSWTAGGKQGFGTSVTTESKVWYTLGQGIVNEVYYPRLDVPNVQDLQYVVTDGSTFTDVEGVDTDQAVELPDAEALTQKQVNTDKQGRYRITKTYATDPDRPTLLVQTRFEVLSGGPLSLYVLYNPSLNNSGKGDTGATSGSRLVSSDGPVASALAASPAFTRLTTGYSGTASDPYTQLTTARSLPVTYDNAPSGGNIAQAARISVGTDTTFTLALGFGTDRGAASAAADASLAAGYPAVETAYADGWHAYLDSLEDRPASVTGDPQLEKQYNVSIMTIKAAEDKTYRGGFIASPSIPWGNWVNADNCCAHGYHAVWPRDLYHKASALIAAGDEEAAERALDYLFDKQQNGDGSFKQNTWLNGTRSGAPRRRTRRPTR